MESPLRLVDQFRRRLSSAAYGSPLYRFMLDQGDPPTAPALVIPDLWPGDAASAQQWVDAQTHLFDHDDSTSASQLTLSDDHSFLRDLRALGSDAARRKARGLLDLWMDQNEIWQDDVWDPSVLGPRLANWIAFFDFYAQGAAPAFTERVMRMIQRQARHLVHVFPRAPAGLDSLKAIKGIFYAGFALPAMETALGMGMDLICRQMDAEILPDGGHISRNPSEHFAFFQILVDLREAFRAAGLPAPEAILFAIQRLLPVIKFFRHGDGGLASFHGGGEEKPLQIDAALSLSLTRARLLHRLPHMGYERVAAGRSLLFVDVASAAPHPYDRAAHAGFLSFEFSSGKERLIVNCGPAPHADPAWVQAMASTAAHNTITIEDTNAAPLLDGGGIAPHHAPFDVARYEQDGRHYIEAAHDNYAKAFGVTVKRVLSLSADGDHLAGQDLITGPAGLALALRWHLHPGVLVSLVQDGRAALLRTPSGQGWRLRLDDEDFTLSIEPSVYCGSGTRRRSLQLKLSGCTRAGALCIGWRLSRERATR